MKTQIMTAGLGCIKYPWKELIEKINTCIGIFFILHTNGTVLSIIICNLPKLVLILYM